MVFEKLVDIIAEQLELDKSVIKETSTLSGDLGAGSLDMIDLIMSIEDEFHIEIPDDIADKVKTVKDLAEYLEKHGK